jgi:hypothetical protein
LMGYHRKAGQKGTAFLFVPSNLSRLKRVPFWSIPVQAMAADCPAKLQLNLPTLLAHWRQLLDRFCHALQIAAREIQADEPGKARLLLTTESTFDI